MAKKAPPAPASAASDHVVTVREWNPHRSEPVSVIHDAIDAWDGRRASATSSAASPAASGSRATQAAPLGHDELRAKVDRLTKHVKARTVTVTETVTELVEFEEAEAQATSSRSAPRSPSRSGEPWDAESVPARRTPKRKAKPARKGKKAASRKKR